MNIKRTVLLIMSFVLVVCVCALGYDYFVLEYNHIYTPKFDLHKYEQHLIDQTPAFYMEPSRDKETAVRQAKLLWERNTGLEFDTQQVRVSYCQKDACWLIQECFPKWPPFRNYIGILFSAIIAEDGKVMAVWFE